MDLVKNGKSITITIIAVVILLDIISSLSVFLMYSGGNENVLTIMIRLILECLLLYFLYIGHRWAKVLTAILLLIGGVLSVLTGITLIGSPLDFLMTLAFGLVFIISGIILIKSKSVNTFFSYQRERLSNMDPLKKGKKIIISLISIFIFTSIITTVECSFIYASNNDTVRLISQLTSGTIRLSLECVIFVFLYKGREWAKTLTIILFLVGGVFGVIRSIALLGASTFAILLIIMSLLYVGFAVVLITSKSIEHYLSNKRAGISDIYTKPEEDNQLGAG
ncbi:hypothetical protein FRZ06_02135 [Anoxybacterium hadale]|uniref:Uncharacterized protein n=1 Tax=Anoxybacterium hadale TaxID=3408580 RepID=A0ACD1A729_9FIRM|nr:hypothetical protein FRZ06_02135 [Clostridiales bacterium]